MTQLDKEYAAALYMLAAESGSEREYAAALEAVSSVLAAEPDYILLLRSPSIPKEERTRALAEAFEGRVPEQVLSFMQLLCEHGQIGAFEGCREEYDRLLREAERRSIAYVTSAAELDAAQKARLKEKLERTSGDKIELVCEVDPSLVGGVTVKLGDKLLDGSLKSRLQDAREAMKG